MDVMLSWRTEIRIPRYIGGCTGIEFLLCGFSDTSERSYAAVLYIHVTDQSQKVTVYLLGAKTKPAPLKTTTITRLELSGAILLAHQWPSGWPNSLANCQQSWQHYAPKETTSNVGCDDNLTIFFIFIFTVKGFPN